MNSEKGSDFIINRNFEAVLSVSGATDVHWNQFFNGNFIGKLSRLTENLHARKIELLYWKING